MIKLNLFLRIRFTPIALSLAENLRFTPRTVQALRWSGSFFAVLGGILLASNTHISGYGFVLLAMSSSQMLLSSYLLGDQVMMVYSGSVFIFVDCFGVYRWLLT
jgi:hypothetical protein